MSSAFEARLLRSATGGDLSLRKAVSNAVRALLLLIGLLVALTAAGIDLTALSVLGGAVGVGIGLGLQKLASNYVSGFVMLAERSVRIGDSVRVDNFEGVVTDINARYSVIRSTDRARIHRAQRDVHHQPGRESLAERPHAVAVDGAAGALRQRRGPGDAVCWKRRRWRSPGCCAARRPPWRCRPLPIDGLEFTVGYWIGDPENGQLNVRSDVNRAILLALRAQGIQVPPPLRPAAPEIRLAIIKKARSFYFSCPPGSRGPRKGVAGGKTLVRRGRIKSSGFSRISPLNHSMESL